MRDEKESRETMDTGYSKWRKLDNAALAFPLVTGKDDTRVFRFYCQLKEKVDGEILQSALDQAMEKYPLFQAVLRKGLFWFYLEHRSLRAVVNRRQSRHAAVCIFRIKNPFCFRSAMIKTESILKYFMH